MAIAVDVNDLAYKAPKLIEFLFPNWTNDRLDLMEIRKQNREYGLEERKKLFAQNLFSEVDNFKSENIFNMFSKASEKIPEDAEIKKEDINPQFIAEFIDNAKNVCAEDLQDIWAELIATELQKPGTYSLETLQWLRKRTSEDIKDILDILNHSTTIYDIYAKPIFLCSTIFSQNNQNQLTKYNLLDPVTNFDFYLNFNHSLNDYIPIFRTDKFVLLYYEPLVFDTFDQLNTNYPLGGIFSYPYKPFNFQSLHKLNYTGQEIYTLLMPKENLKFSPAETFSLTQLILFILLKDGVEFPEFSVYKLEGFRIHKIEKVDEHNIPIEISIQNFLTDEEKILIEKHLNKLKTSAI
jgi:hypothetical protein